MMWIIFSVIAIAVVAVLLINLHLTYKDIDSIREERNSAYALADELKAKNEASQAEVRKFSSLYNDLLKQEVQLESLYKVATKNADKLKAEVAELRAELESLLKSIRTSQRKVLFNA